VPARVVEKFLEDFSERAAPARARPHRPFEIGRVCDPLLKGPGQVGGSPAQLFDEILFRRWDTLLVTMRKHKTWPEVHGQGLRRPAARGAYEEARLAYEIGRQVRELREAQGLSQSQLADRMGTTQSVIARLEAGGSRPTLRTLERAATALRVRVKVHLDKPRSVAAS